jgi:hypothetical protein
MSDTNNMSCVTPGCLLIILSMKPPPPLSVSVSYSIIIPLSSPLKISLADSYAAER